MKKLYPKMKKEGVKTDLFIEHPFIKGKKLPVYIANFILWITDQGLFMVVLHMIKEI